MVGTRQRQAVRQSGHGQHKPSSTVAPYEARDQRFVPTSRFPHAAVAECHGLEA